MARLGRRIGAADLELHRGLADDALSRLGTNPKAPPLSEICSTSRPNRQRIASSGGRGIGRTLS